MVFSQDCYSIDYRVLTWGNKLRKVKIPKEWYYNTIEITNKLKHTKKLIDQKLEKAHNSNLRLNRESIRLVHRSLHKLFFSLTSDKLNIRQCRDSTGSIWASKLNPFSKNLIITEEEAFEKINEVLITLILVHKTVSWILDCQED